MTNKIFAIIFACCSFQCVKGQIKKSSILLGGQVSYSNSTTDNSTSQSDNESKSGFFNLSIGKAFKENAIYGSNISYSPYSSKNIYTSSTSTDLKYSRYTLGFFYRNYSNLAKDFYFFTEAGISYLTSKQTNTNVSGVEVSTEKQNGGRFYLTPGLSYKIFKKLQLEIIIPNIAAIQYTNSSSKSEANESKQKSFSINSSLNSSGINSLGVGFHLIF